MNHKVIISCALTGAIHTPTLSPHLPYRPEDIARQAIDAANAGASILHLHARDPETGQPSGDPALFMEFVPAIRAATNAVINITTGGGLTHTLDQRLAPALRVKPELASFNMGSINFSIHRLARRHSEWQFDWEEPYLRGTESNIFRNTFVDMKRVIQELGEGCNTCFEYECYDIGHLYNLAYLVDEGLAKPPLFLQAVFGILGGMGTDIELLGYFKSIADRLFGRENYEWSAIGAGRHQMRIATAAAIMGGNVRVGLEDSLYVGKGELAKCSGDQVRKVRRILEELSFEIAIPDEVRARLGLKGADRVGV